LPFIEEELTKEGVAMTTVEGLTASHVLHLVHQETLAGWRNKMAACLLQANSAQLKSVAFPVFNSG